MATVASIVVNLSVSTARFEKGLGSAQRMAKQFVKSTKSITRDLDEIARYGRKAGLALAGLSAAGLGITKLAANHEEAMIRVKSISRATVAEYQAMSKAAIDMSAKTVHALSDIDEGMKFLAMAGYKAQDIMKIMPNVGKLAVVGNTDISESGRIMLGIMSGYQLSADQLGGVVDILASSITGANVSLTEMGEAFRYVGPIAHSAGVEFETTAAALSLLGDANIRGSIGGTSLKAVFGRLLAPSRSVQKVFKRLGLTTTDSTGKLRDFADIIEDLTKSGATAADIMKIFGQRAGPAMAALIGFGADALRDYEERLRSSAGLADLIEAEQMQSFNAQFKLMKNQFVALGTELGQILLPAAKTVNYYIMELADKFRNLTDEQKENIVKWVTVGSAILGLIAVFGLVAGAISVFVKGLTVMGIIVAFATSPITLALVGIAIAVGYMARAWNENWGGIQDKTKTVTDKLKQYWSSFYTWWNGVPAVTSEGITSGFDEDQPGFKHKLLEYKDLLTKGWDFVVNIAQDVWDWIFNTTWAEKWEDIKQLLTKGWTFTIEIGQEVKEWFFNTKLGQVLQKAYWSVHDWWNGVPAVTSEGITSGFDVDQPGFKHKLLEIKDSIMDVWEEIKARTIKTWEEIKVKLGEVWDEIKLLAQETWDKIKNTVVVSAILEFGGDVYDALKQGFDTGEWGPFWSKVSEGWSKGVVIGIYISETIVGLGVILDNIRTGLGLAAVAGESAGIHGVLGALTVVIQLMEAKTNNSFREFGANLIAALLAGFAVWGVTGSPKQGAIAFTVVLNFKIGEHFLGWIDELIVQIGYIQYMLEHISPWELLTKQHPKELLGYAEWVEYLRTGEKLYDHLWYPEISAEPTVSVKAIPDTSSTNGSNIYFDPGGYGADIAQLIRVWSFDPAFDALRAKLAEYDVELASFLVRLAQSESTIQNLPMDLSKGSTAQGYFQLLASSRESVEKQMGEVNWDDDFEQIMASIHWLRLGVEGEFDTIVAAAERFNIDMEQALKLWWVAGGPGLAKMQSLDQVLTSDKTGKQILGRFSSGTPFTGWGALDEPAGIVHKQEAVIPWKVLKRGGLAVLDFLGMPGFKTGKAVSIPGFKEATFTVETMQELFTSLGHTILEGIATLFDLIVTGIEGLVIAIWGEDKLEEIKSTFDRFRDGLQDFMDRIAPTKEEDKPKVDAVVKSALELAFENISWDQPVDSFVQSFSSGLMQAESELVQFLGEMTRFVRVELEKVDDKVVGLTLNLDAMLQDMASALFSMVGESLASLLSWDYGSGLAKRQDPFPNLTEVIENFENWDKNHKKLKRLEAAQDVATLSGASAGAGVGFAVGASMGSVGGPLGALIGGFIGALAMKKTGEALAKSQIEELTQKLQDDFQKIKELLGTTIQDVANGLANAFQADTYEGFVDSFAESLEKQTANALITAFMTETYMRDMLDGLSETISWAVMDGVLDQAELEDILSQSELITEASKPFFESLQELGIWTGEAADTMKGISESLRNVPQGLKIVSNRLAVAGANVPGVQAMSASNYEGAPQTPEVHNHFHGTVYGMDDFDRRVNAATGRTSRGNRLATHGVG